METVVANLLGAPRREVLHGREYLVADATIIVPGVLNGSKGPLYYPEDEVAKDVGAWNGIPVVVYHPTKDGINVSGRDPAVIADSGIGYTFNDRFDGGARKVEAWFDVAATAAYDARLPADARILPRVRNGRPVELSTGLFTENVPVQNGKCPKTGRAYVAVARNYRPDHLAILPDQTGACSVRDGCGVGVTNADGSPAVNHEFNGAGVCTNCGGQGGKPGPCPAQKAATASRHAQRMGIKGYGDASARFIDLAHEHINKANAASLKGDHEAAGIHARKAQSFADHAKKMARKQGAGLRFARMQKKNPKTIFGKVKKGILDMVGVNNTGDTAVDRAAAIKTITTNCKAWEGEEEVLNEMEDDVLEILEADAKARPALTGNATATSPKPAWKTTQEWLDDPASAPAEVKTAVFNAIKIETREKAALIDQIVANRTGDAKTARINQLKDKPIDELREILADMGGARPTANGGAYRLPAVTDYIGAGAGDYRPDRQVVNVDQADILPLPTTDWGAKDAG